MKQYPKTTSKQKLTKTIINHKELRFATSLASEQISIKSY